MGHTLSPCHHAVQDLVRACGLDAAAFWAEVQSVLKGGAAAVQSPHGRLSADGYAALAEQRASDLGAERRSAVYDLFLQYEQLRRQRGHWDVASFTAHVFRQLWMGLKKGIKPMQVSSAVNKLVALTTLLCRMIHTFAAGLILCAQDMYLGCPLLPAELQALCCHADDSRNVELVCPRPVLSARITQCKLRALYTLPLSAQVHTLSVDEVQDLTPAQIMLLKYLCDDAEHGFLLAGDTAQTIAHGMNFRFQVCMTCCC